MSIAISPIEELLAREHSIADIAIDMPHPVTNDQADKTDVRQLFATVAESYSRLVQTCAQYEKLQDTHEIDTQLDHVQRQILDKYESYYLQLASKYEDFLLWRQQTQLGDIVQISKCAS